jgi:hypothetical protein
MPSKLAELRCEVARGTAKLRDRLNVWIGICRGGGQLRSGSGGVGGGDTVSYPTTTRRTPWTSRQLDPPRSLAPTKLNG